MALFSIFRRAKTTAAETVEATDSRIAKREPLAGVTAMIRSAGGVVVEGVVQDVSDGGIGISGDATGLNSGDRIEVVLVIQGEKVGYFGEIRHLDAPNCFYGVLFHSGPFRGEQKRESVKQCRQCHKDYPEDHKFCFRCGQRLIGSYQGSTNEPANKPVPAFPV